MKTSRLTKKETPKQEFVVGLNRMPDGDYLLLGEEQSWMFKYSDHTFRGNSKMSIEEFDKERAEISRHNWQCEYIVNQTDTEQTSIYFSIDKRFVFGKPNKIFIHETIIRRSSLVIGGIEVRPMTQDEKRIAVSRRGRGNFYLTADDVNTGNDEILPSQRRCSLIRQFFEYGKKIFPRC